MRKVSKKNKKKSKKSRQKIIKNKRIKKSIKKNTTIISKKNTNIKKTILAGALTGLLLGLAKKYGDNVSITNLNNYVNSLSLNDLQEFITDIPYKFTTEDVILKEPEYTFKVFNYEPKDLRIKVVNQIFEDILPHGDNVNTNIKPKIEDILKFTIEGNIPQLQYIIQNIGKDIKKYRDSNGNTLIMNIIEESGSTSGDYGIISRENMEKAIVLLGETLVDIDSQNNNGQTALHIATFRYMPEAIDILLSLGADPLIKDKLGKTPIHAAVTRGKPALVNHLIKRNAGINSKDSLGKTILEKLVEIGSENDRDFPFESVMDTLKYLIKNNAHLTLKSFNRIINNPIILNEYKNILKYYKKKLY